MKRFDAYGFNYASAEVLGFCDDVATTLTPAWIDAISAADRADLREALLTGDKAAVDRISGPVIQLNKAVRLASERRRMCRCINAGRAS